MVNRPPTRAKRLFKLAGMTAAIASDMARSKIGNAFRSEEQARAHDTKTRTRSGERMADTLGELKGAVMKIGQMASVGADVLPREVSDALRRLQREAPTIDFEVIAETIHSELGGAYDEIYGTFDRQPFAAASIGQVHRARTKTGREVVVKVQYPGVDEAVESDLSHLKMSLRLSGLLTLDKASLDLLFDETRERLLEELDYELEAENLARFSTMHSDDEGLVFPSLLGDLCAHKVLTTSYEHGIALDRLAAEGFDQPLRDKIGGRLFDLMWRQIFEHRFLHADPNPGNFAAREDGRLVVYDFGCVKRLEQGFVDLYGELLGHAFAGDFAGVERAFIELGVRRPNSPEIDHDLYRRWHRALVQPFLEQPVFDYGQSEIQHRLLELMPSTVKHFRSFQICRDLIFVDRTVLGNYGNLRKLGARVASVARLAEYLPRLRDITQLRDVLAA